MKKAHIVNLIKYHLEENITGFRDLSIIIAREFDKLGDFDIAQYIYALLGCVETMRTQEVPTPDPKHIKKFVVNSFDYNSLALPKPVEADLVKILKTRVDDRSFCRFLFKGAPGTGKTESAKLITKALKRSLCIADLNSIVKNKSAETATNVKEFFDEVYYLEIPEINVALFDDLDALVLSKTINNKVRKNHIVSNSIAEGLRNIERNPVVIAITNQFEHLNQDLIACFDTIIDFDRYSNADLIAVAESALAKYLANPELLKKDDAIIKKILALAEQLPCPADISKMIKVAVSFSDRTDEQDYLRRIYYAITEQKAYEVTKETLEKQGFTVAEIEMLTSQVDDRVLKSDPKAQAAQTN